MHLVLGEFLSGFLGVLLSRKLGCLHRSLQQIVGVDVVCVKIREREFQEFVFVPPLDLALGKI